VRQSPVVARSQAGTPATTAGEGTLCRSRNFGHAHTTQAESVSPTQAFGRSHLPPMRKPAAAHVVQAEWFIRDRRSADRGRLRHRQGGQELSLGGLDVLLPWWVIGRLRPHGGLPGLRLQVLPPCRLLLRITPVPRLRGLCG